MKFFYITIIALVCLSFNKQKPFIPPGTIQINDTLFADETEISNFSWQEFELWTASIYGKNSPEHIAVLPDTLSWRDKITYNEPYVGFYYRHPAYRNYPVVGISYEQAKAYCTWRTARVKNFLSIRKDFKNQNFEYKLPTKTEWELIAESSSVFLNHNGKSEKGLCQLNCLIPFDTLKTYDSSNPSDVTAPVDAYQKNRLGLYNMLGNVAEMVAEKGICKGGSWKNDIEECRVGKSQEYTKPYAWLGFRCICIKTKI
jgi:formylglycine-generating enzyme required for sulfatase activity